MTERGDVYHAVYLGNQSMCQVSITIALYRVANLSLARHIQPQLNKQTKLNQSLLASSLFLSNNCFFFFFQFFNVQVLLLGNVDQVFHKLFGGAIPPSLMVSCQVHMITEECQKYQTRVQPTRTAFKFKVVTKTGTHRMGIHRNRGLQLETRDRMLCTMLNLPPQHSCKKCFCLREPVF